MKLPLSLIQSFLPIQMALSQIGEILTLLGIEVDHIQNESPPFAGVVVGEVLSVKRHPDAKNLQIAEVTDGKETVTLVCGASNCRVGIKTAFAKIGAVLKIGRIEKTIIRGVESSGRLCSSSELKLSDDHEGILELPADFKNGTDLIKLLWDPVFELSLTPNLGHCMSALGIARELSAATQIPLHPLNGALTLHPIDKKVEIDDFTLCPRYMCALLERVDAGPSPFALKKALEACGQKSINRLVDTANFIMMKMGQPMHAFDADLLEGDTIRVAPAKTAQKFLGLDGVEREVPAGALLIWDSKKPVAIAGIMGGAETAVSEKTTRILLEAAYFDPVSIRSTSRKMGLRSESSQRFEKGIDPVGIEAALYEACRLIGGQIKGCVDLKKGSFSPKEIAYRASRINHLLGTKLSETEIEEILERLGIHCKSGKAIVPLYRADIAEEIDLVEEVARIYGYNNIEKTIPICTTSQLANDPIFVFENETRRRLAGLGLSEFLTCDLIGQKLAEVSREITPPSMEVLKAAYSKSEEYCTLRTSLLPGLLQVVKGNIAQKNLSIGAFEIGRIHFMQEGKVMEIPMAAILLTGKAELPHWSRKTTDVDFFDLKGIVENIVDGPFKPSSHLAFHPGRQTDICHGDLIVGSLGEVHPSLLEKFDISQRIYYAELNLTQLRKPRKAVKPLPQFPSSERDWTLPLDPKITIDTLFKAIHSSHSPLLEKVELIDLYQPEPTEKKHATFRFTYRDPFKTISFEEVESEHGKMMHHVANLLAK
jgi:phenylalanyl-tRNA synthetase beta chain